MNWLDKTIAMNPSVPPLVLPRKFENAVLSEIPEGTLKRATTSYLEQFWQVAPEGIGCLFLGRAGKYKTYASCLIAKTVHAKGPLETMVVQCPILFSRIERARFSQDSEKLLKEVCRVPFLVMDDFSQIRPNSFGAGMLLEVAEHRFSNLLPTIWTGNISVSNPTQDEVRSALSTLYGPSFGRRLTEASRGFGVYIK